jgi:hypothetical protein
MCFSAVASFTASAILLPAGLYGLQFTWQHHSKLIPLSCIPIAFAMQQACEGLVWLGSTHGNLSAMNIGSLSFLAFAYWLWLVWAPWSVAEADPSVNVQRVSQLLSLVGFIYGALLYLPLLIQPDWLTIHIIHHSIQYQTTLIFDNWVSQEVDRAVYAVIIVTPFLIASNPLLKILGGLVLTSAIATYLMLNQVFVSVWCFFAAIISLYILYVLFQTAAPTNHFSESEK